MVIAIDIDNTVLDTAAALVAYFNKKCNMHVTDFSGFNIEKTFPIKKKEVYLALDEIDPVFFPGAVNVLEKLDFEFLTARKHTKNIRLKKYIAEFFPDKEIIVCESGKKYEYDFDLFIDDSVEEIEAMKEAGKNFIIFDRLWNKHVCGPRLYDWSVITDEMQRRMFGLCRTKDTHV